MRTNAHVHLPPNFSAFATAGEAARLAAAARVEVLGASNYYDFTVYDEFGKACDACGVRALYGLELLALDDDLRANRIRANDPANPGRVYVCGKGLRRWAAAHEHPTLRRSRAADQARVAEMAARLSATLGVTLDEPTIRTGVARAVGAPQGSVVLQERHLAAAFYAAIPTRFTSPAQLRSTLMKAGQPAYVEEAFVPLQEAVSLIHDLGGVPSYPIVGVGMGPPSEFEDEPAILALELRARGFRAAEFIPPRNSPDAIETYARPLLDAGITLTAGTEHNTPELIPLVPVCLGGAPVPAWLAQRFDDCAHEMLVHQEAP